MPIPPEPWSDISLDLITDLPLTPRGHDAVVVFVDRLTKRCHFAPTRTRCTGRDVATIFVEHVFRHHGLPRRIVSDRDPRFTGAFWKEVFHLLGTKLQMSTAQHPQTDGQTERTNRVLEESLRHFVNYRQNNWDALLPLVEFAVNNSVQASTGYSPFFLDMGRNPNTPVCLISNQGLSSSPAPAAEDFARQMKSTLTAARDALATAQDRQKKYADAHRQPAPTFAPGDSVWVTRDLFLDQANRRRPKDKFKPRWQGPFPVLNMPSQVTVRLDFSGHPHVRAHPVVHISKVKRCLESAPDFAGRPHDEPPPMEVNDDGTEEYEAESILDERVRRGKTEYLVKWAGYDINDATWEPESHLVHAQDILQSWRQRSS